MAEKVLMKGNEALAEAAIQCGCKHYFGYPITPQTEVYEGMIIGVSSKTQDIEVNPTVNKKMTAIRSTGNDEAMKLVPARVFSLEEALEFINDDELVEITPDAIRLRKRYLTNLDRRRHMREVTKEANKQ